MDASRSATRETARTQATSPITRVRARASTPRALVLGRYRLHRRLGAGGFGTVWLARDERLDRDVAVKVLPRERVVGGRFEREARAAARLSHPGIVTLYEAAVDDDGAYLVSELVSGATLDSLLEAGRLSDRDIVLIGIALAGALIHAHSQGVVHRDVKPSNVLVPEHPATPEQAAKLTDFGVARVVGGDTLTRTGDVLGTAAYMSPEQATGREAGAASDLYSLALVLYEGLAGVNPLRSAPAAVPTRRLAMHLPPLRRYRRDLPRDVARALDLALRPRARERGSLEELREALAGTLGTVADRPGVVEGPWRPRGSGERSWRPRSAATDEPEEVWREPGPSDSEAELPASLPGRAPWPERIAGTVAAGAVGAWLTAELVSNRPAPVLLTAVASAVAVAVLPRLGWIAATLAGCLALVLGGHPGAAMVVGGGLLLPSALMPLRPRRWPLAAMAPLLGLAGLAGAWPALAARGGSPWRRAALGALGWIWLLLAGALHGAGLYTRLPQVVPAPGIWTASTHEAARHVLTPLIGGALLAPALVWALAAVVLPSFTSTSSPRARILLAGAWSLTLVLATVTVLALARAPVGVPVGAAVLGALAASGLAAVRYGLR